MIWNRNSNTPTPTPYGENDPYENVPLNQLPHKVQMERYGFIRESDQSQDIMTMSALRGFIRDNYAVEKGKVYNSFMELKSAVTIYQDYPMTEVSFKRVMQEIDLVEVDWKTEKVTIL